MSTTRARSAAIAVGERATFHGCAVPARHETGQRRYVDPTACDAEFAAAVEEFQQAMEQYKQSSGRMFPTWCEVLEVLEGLRYRKVGHEAAGPPGRCGHDPDDRGWPPRR
jgi:hypothetical protein